MVIEPKEAETLTEEDKNNYRVFFESLKNTIPCPKCREHYSENLKQIKQVDFIKFNPSHSFYVFQILLKERKKLIEKFKSLGVGFSIQYLKPINQMSYYKKKYNLLDKNFKSSNLFSKQIISLPVYPKLKNKEIDFVCNSIKQMFNES